jgi:hypothetical protein
MTPRHALTIALLAASGCGGETPAAQDAGLDAARADVPTVDAVPDGAACVLTPPAGALPEINGRVRVEGGDAGAVPTPSGGDPTGRWLIEDATAWLPAAAAGQVMTEQSWVRGTGWATLEGGRYQIATDLGFRVESIVGGLTRGVALSGRGRYEVRGTELVLTPECMGAAPVMGSLGAFRFSREAPGRAQLFVEVIGMAGRLTLIFQLRNAN